MPSNAQTYTFGDDPPVTSGKKLRRGRGCGRKNNTSSTSKKTNTKEKSNNSSYRSTGGHYSSAASLSAQAQHKKSGSSGSQKYFTTGDAWDNPSNTSSKNGGYINNNTNDDNDDNSCTGSGTGSLTYSASSSVQSAESSNDSSFADIIKLIDSEGEGASEIKDFIAKQTKAASGSDPGGNNIYGKEGKNAAVAGWVQRVEDRSRQQQAAQAKKKQQQSSSMNYSMAKSSMPTNSNVDLNYSKDDSSEDDVFGVDFDENILETIAGLDEEIARQSQAHSSDSPFRTNRDPYQTTASSSLAAPSSPRSRSSGHVTPPPNSRLKRTSTPPDATNISRTNSRHSKSSSDGSWDTPAPSSPPHCGSVHSASKPPHARTPASKTRRNKSGKEDKVVEDLSEAVYTKSWMCGFTDAFNFEGFDKFNS